jgi:NitT/TauT family transport system substrate-binding protein
MRFKLNLFAGLAAAFFASAANAQQPVKLRAAYIVPGANIFSIFLAKPELLRHHGKSYVLEPIRYQATPLMVTALAVGELEIGLLNSTSLSLAVENAGLEDIRVFADEFRDGVEGYVSNQFMTRAGDGPKTPAEMKGKVLASNAVGSMVDIAARAFLRKAGLEDKRDYTVIEAQLPTMKSLLFEKKVDLIAGVPPFLYDPQLQAEGRALFSQRDAMGPSELGFWGAKDDFLKKNRAAMIDFLEDTLVHRSRQQRRSHQACRRDDQGAAGDLPGLAVHEEGLLPRSRPAPRCRRDPGQHRAPGLSRLREGQARCEEIRRSRICRGGVGAREVREALHAR